MSHKEIDFYKPSDKEFLGWIYKRLQNVHNESELFDYMHRLKAIVEITPEDRHTSF